MVRQKSVVLIMRNREKKRGDIRSTGRRKKKKKKKKIESQASVGLTAPNRLAFVCCI